MGRSTRRPGIRTKQVAVKIKSLREAHNMTTAEAADLLGITQTFMSRLEQGGTPFDVERLHQIAGIYGLSVSYLLGDISPERDVRIRELMGKPFAAAMKDKRFAAVVGQLALAFQNEQSNWLFESCARICKL